MTGKASPPPIPTPAKPPNNNTDPAAYGGCLSNQSLPTKCFNATEHTSFSSERVRPNINQGLAHSPTSILVKHFYQPFPRCEKQVGTSLFPTSTAQSARTITSSITLPRAACLCRRLSVSLCLSASLPACQPACLFACLSFCLCLSVCLSVSLLLFLLLLLLLTALAA